MIEYPYELDKSSKKFVCPNCKRKTFVRFADTKTREYLPEQYGKCDRENNCGYESRPPKAEKSYAVQSEDLKRGCNNDVSIVPSQDVEKTLNRFVDNFSKFIIERYGELGKAALKNYNVGSCTKGTIFWQKAQSQVFRAGKIIEYGTDGYRRKDVQITWEHTINKRENFTLNQCLFGSHLIKPDTEKVFIVESEKTAIIGSIKFPEKLFLATGGVQNFGQINALRKEIRKIIIPDCGKATAEWTQKAKEIPNSFIFEIEKHCTQAEIESGADIADLWLNYKKIEPDEPTADEQYKDYIDDLDVPLKEIASITNWRGIDICRQTMTIIQGKPKAKKSALAQLICSDILKQNRKTKILYFDTEMSEKSVRIRTLSVAKLANIHDFKERFKKIKCRKMLNSERKDFVLKAISDFKCDIVVIDGVLDLINDFNDQKESNMLIAELNKCTAENNCHLILLLHQNKGNSSGQGHLGYFLEKKSDTLIDVNFTDKHTSVAVLKYDRDGGDFENFEFGFGQGGLQYFDTDFAPQAKNARTKTEKQIFEF